MSKLDREPKRPPEPIQDAGYLARERVMLAADDAKLDRMIAEDDIPEVYPTPISIAERSRLRILDRELQNKIRPIIEGMLTKGKTP